jgi:hypothetical protein
MEGELKSGFILMQKLWLLRASTIKTDGKNDRKYLDNYSEYNSIVHGHGQ